MKRLIVILILTTFVQAFSYAQTAKDMIQRHSQWVETHTPKPEELTDEQLLLRVAEIIQGVSHEKAECALIRACGKWDAYFIEYADFFENNKLDPQEQRRIKALQSLINVTTKVCGKSSLANLQARYQYACTSSNYDDQKAVELIKSVFQESKRSSNLDSKEAEESYSYYLLYKVSDIVLRLNMCETPGIWKEVMEAELEAMQFLTKHNVENQAVADIYQYLAVMKGRSIAFPDAFSSAMFEVFSGQECIPEHDVCGDRNMSDSRYLYEMSLYINSRLHGDNSISAIYCLHDYCMFLTNKGFGLNEGQKENVYRYRDAIKEYLPVGSVDVLQYEFLSEMLKADSGTFTNDWCHGIIRQFDNFYGKDAQATVNAFATMLMQKAQANPEGLQELISEYDSMVNQTYRDDELNRLNYLSYMITCKQSVGLDFLDFVNQFIAQYKKIHKPTWKSIVCGHDMANILAYGVNNAEAAVEIQEIVIEDVKKLVGTNDIQLALELQTLSGYYGEIQVQKSIDCMKQAINIFERKGEQACALYYTLADKYNCANDRAQTLSAIDKAIAACPTDNEAALVLYKLYKANRLMEGNDNEIKQGEKLFKEILPKFLSIKPSLTIMDLDCFLFVGYAYYYIGDMQAAIDILKEGRSFYIEQGGYEESVINSYTMLLVDIYANQLNDYTTAISTIDEEIARLKSVNEQFYLTYIFDLIDTKQNILYSIGADWTKLAPSLTDFTQYFIKMKEQTGEADDIVIKYGLKVYSTMMQYISRLKGEYDREYKNMVVNTPKQKEEKDFATKSMNMMLEQFKQLGNVGDEIYSRLMRVKNVKLGSDYYTYMLMKANFEDIINNNYSKAKSILETAIADSRKNNINQLFGLLSEYISLCVYHSDKEFAAKSTKELIELQEKNKDLLTPVSNINTNYKIWSAFYPVHEYKQCLTAARSYFENVKKLTDINFDLMSESERNELINQYGTGGSMLQVLLPHFPTEISGEVYNTMLYEKGLLLRSSERIRRAVLSSDNPKVKALMDSLNIVDAQLKRTGTSNFTDISDQSWMLKSAKLTAKKERIEHEIINSVKSGMPQREPNHEWSEIRTSLKSGDVAIEMVFSDSILGALILRPEDSQPQYVRLCNTMNVFNSLNKASSLTSLGFSESVYKDDCAQLYKNLWAPIELLLKDSKRIFISPTGFLNNIAFHALLMPDGSYTCDHYDIYQLTSTAELLKNHEEHRPISAALYGGIYYGNSEPTTFVKSGVSQRAYDDERGTSSEPFKYLPSTLTELNNIWKHYTSSSAEVSKSSSASIKGWTYHTGLSATESSIIQLDGKSPDIIHLATHGFFIKNNKDVESNKFLAKFKGAKYDSMIRSGLAMNNANDTWRGKSTKADTDDGILTASDISLLDFSKSQLVTMSACETALGTYTTDGVYGLQRGFKQAGVQSIIASLWSVNDDSSSLFMTEFYTSWLSGKSKHEAMRQALNVTRSKYPSPYYWAPFVLIDAVR